MFSWEREEEKKLAESSVDIAEDHITENAQQDEHLWLHIIERFHIVIGCGEYRTKDQCTSKFHEMIKTIKKIQRDIQQLVNSMKKGGNRSNYFRDDVWKF